MPRGLTTRKYNTLTCIAGRLYVRISESPAVIKVLFQEVLTQETRKQYFIVYVLILCNTQPPSRVCFWVATQRDIKPPQPRNLSFISTTIIPPPNLFYVSLYPLLMPPFTLRSDIYIYRFLSVNHHTQSLYETTMGSSIVGSEVLLDM